MPIRLEDLPPSRQNLQHGQWKGEIRSARCCATPFSPKVHFFLTLCNSAKCAESELHSVGVAHLTPWATKPSRDVQTYDACGNGDGRAEAMRFAHVPTCNHTNALLPKWWPRIGPHRQHETYGADGTTTGGAEVRSRDAHTHQCFQSFTSMHTYKHAAPAIHE